MKVLFVVNPKSGIRKTNNLDSTISHLSDKYQLEYKTIFTEGSNDNKKIRHVLEEFKPDTAVAVGGDGTINLLASELIKSNITLGIIPVGSANGLASNLNIPNDVEPAFIKLVDKTPKPLDVIVLNDTYNCFHLSDIGLNARVVKRFEDEESRGLAGYAKQLIKELFSERTAFRAQIDTADAQIKLKAEMIVIANAKSFGTGAKINPLGEPDDGKFEIVVIKPYRWWIMLRLAISIFTGKLHTLNNIKIFAVNEAGISFQKPPNLQIDGEIIEGISSLDVRIIPDAINVYY